MLRTLLCRLGLRDGDDTDVAESEERTADGENEDGDADEDGFLPSRLDASVLESHGMSTTAAERELQSIEEKAQTLESDREQIDSHEQVDDHGPVNDHRR